MSKPINAIDQPDLQRFLATLPEDGELRRRADAFAATIEPLALVRQRPRDIADRIAAIDMAFIDTGAKEATALLAERATLAAELAALPVKAEALARRYAEGPAQGGLDELPPRPRFVICATDMRFREQWVFDSAGRIGSRSAGHFPPSPNWTLARAVAASSCVPGPFRAMRVRDGVDALSDGAYAGDDRDRLVRSIDLADGGVYDNLGIEPVWRDHAVVLVSDASPSLSPDPPIRAVWRALRFAVTLLEQATEVRKRWLLSSFMRGDLEGAYWGIASKPSHYELEPAPTSYSDDFVERFIAPVRIDIDAFSEGEIGVLENHGYLIADAAVRRHGAELATGVAPLSAPHPDWLDEGRAAGALADSANTRFFSRRLRI